MQCPGVRCGSRRCDLVASLLVCEDGSVVRFHEAAALSSSIADKLSLDVMHRLDLRAACEMSHGDHIAALAL